MSTHLVRDIGYNVVVINRDGKDLTSLVDEHNYCVKRWWRRGLPAQQGDETKWTTLTSVSLGVVSRDEDDVGGNAVHVKNCTSLDIIHLEVAHLSQHVDNTILLRELGEGGGGKRKKIRWRVPTWRETGKSLGASAGKRRSTWGLVKPKSATEGIFGGGGSEIHLRSTPPNLLLHELGTSTLLNLDDVQLFGSVLHTQCYYIIQTVH